MNLRASVRLNLKKPNSSKVVSTVVLQEKQRIQTRGSKKLAINDQALIESKPKRTTRRLKPLAQKLGSNLSSSKPNVKNIAKVLCSVVTRSRFSKNKVITPTKTPKMSKETCMDKSVSDNMDIVKKNEPNSNPITNYFKIDPIPKEERMKKNLLIKSARKRKSVCWGNASLSLDKSPSNSMDDPYEFVSNSPKCKKPKRKAYRKTLAVNKIRSKFYKMDSNEVSPLKITLNDDESPGQPPVLAQKSFTQEKSMHSKETLPAMELSSINVTSSDNLMHKCKTIDVTGDSEITPVENDLNKLAFKTPALPLKATENDLHFFSKAAAVSTPKLTNSKHANELAKKPEETFTVAKPNIALTESTPYVSKPKSPSKELKRNAETFVVIDTENILPEPLKVVSSETIDISIIKETLIASEHSPEADVDIYDNIDMVDLENDCILSGSFVDCEKSVYKNEDFNRASTPDNNEIINHSSRYFTRSPQKDAFESPSTSINPDPFSLYGSPIKLSPVKASDSEEEEVDENYEFKISPIKKIGRKTRLKSSAKNKSNASPMKKLKKNETRAHKRKEPKNPAYEKWLKNFKAEIEEAEKTILIVE